MTVYEFKQTVGQFLENVCHTVQPLKIQMVELNRGIRLVFSAQKERDGLLLVWKRVVLIPEDRLVYGLGDLVSSLLNLAHYGGVSVQDGRGPFDHTSYETEDRWYLDFGNGVLIEAHRLREQESRTTRILASLGTPWPEWRCAPGYPKSLNGVFGWDARWAEARAERSARACYKMLSASYRRLDVHSGKGAVQRPGAGFEPTQDHDSQTWPQNEL